MELILADAPLRQEGATKGENLRDISFFVSCHGKMVKYQKKKNLPQYRTMNTPDWDLA